MDNNLKEFDAKPAMQVYGELKMDKVTVLESPTFLYLQTFAQSFWQELVTLKQEAPDIWESMSQAMLGLDNLIQKYMPEELELLAADRLVTTFGLPEDNGRMLNAVFVALAKKWERAEKNIKPTAGEIQKNMMLFIAEVKSMIRYKLQLQLKQLEAEQQTLQKDTQDVQELAVDASERTQLYVYKNVKDADKEQQDINTQIIDLEEQIQKLYELYDQVDAASGVVSKAGESSPELGMIFSAMAA